MTTERPEILIEGSDDGADWRPYAFRWKPGDVAARPRFVAPHQPRLDWQMWFAALGSIEENPWLVQFLGRLLEGSPEVVGLLAANPFPDHPPRYVRATTYDYRFTDSAERRRSGAWWRRKVIGPYSPVLERGRLAGSRGAARPGFEAREEMRVGRHDAETRAASPSRRSRDRWSESVSRLAAVHRGWRRSGPTCPSSMPATVTRGEARKRESSCSFLRRDCPAQESGFQLSRGRPGSRRSRPPPGACASWPHRRGERPSTRTCRGGRGSLPELGLDAAVLGHAAVERGGLLRAPRPGELRRGRGGGCGAFGAARPPPRAGR